MRPQKQQLALSTIIIVMLVGLAYELMYIENILRTAIVTPEEDCREFCDSLGSVMYFHDGQCFCKEPITIDEQLYCVSGEEFLEGGPYTKTFNTTQVRNLAVSSVVQYERPNDFATKAFAIYDTVSRRLKYVSDPRKDDYIATPKETWEVQGGDCDDSAILLASMYESVGLDARIAQVWNETYGHVFVLLKVEEDPGIFMKGMEILMNKHTLLFGPKSMNFVVFAESQDECQEMEQNFETGSPMDIYVTIDSNALGFIGHSNPLLRFSNRQFFKVGES